MNIEEFMKCYHGMLTPRKMRIFHHDGRSIIRLWGIVFFNDVCGRGFYVDLDHGSLHLLRQSHSFTSMALHVSEPVDCPEEVRDRYTNLLEIYKTSKCL